MRELINGESEKVRLHHLNFFLMIVFLLIFFVILLLHSPNAQATDVGGHITQDTIWNASGNPYIIRESTWLNKDVNLTIEPGVVIKFDGDKRIEIGGNLEALGNETEKITFTTLDNNTMIGECGLFIHKSGYANIKYCEFSFMLNGIRIQDKSNISISYSKFHNITESGLKIVNSSKINILNCEISDIAYHGIEIDYSTDLLISNTNFLNISREFLFFLW